jgi:hypothetical protein
VGFACHFRKNLDFAVYLKKNQWICPPLEDQSADFNVAIAQFLDVLVAWYLRNIQWILPATKYSSASHFLAAILTTNFPAKFTQLISMMTGTAQEMSETVYPTMSSQLSSSCNGQEEQEHEQEQLLEQEQQQQEQRLEQQLEQTSSTLRTARKELGATQQELYRTALRLHQDRGGQSTGGSPGGAASPGARPGEGGDQVAEIREAFSALQRAQEEICQLR